MDILKTGKFLSKKDKDIEEKELPDTPLVAIYFTAHWCPPCRQFTPILGTFYEEVNEDEDNKVLEVIFCSSDKTQAAFNEYFEKMDWMAIPFVDDRSLKLKSHFSVTGIPRLIVMNRKGDIISQNARMDVTQKGPQVIEEWMNKIN